MQIGVYRQFWSTGAPLLAIVLLGAAAGWLFQTWTSVDLDVSRAFRVGGDFIGNQPLVELVRDGFRVLYAVTIVLAILGLLDHHRVERLGVQRRGWLIVLACLIVGPGLIANFGFKQNWGRPRPHQTIEFGGTKMFIPAGQPSAECKRHCSFVSGEAAATFSVFYSLALVLPAYRLSLVAIGTTAGLVAGFVRISQGGHFFSDVIFAGILMAFVSVGVHRFVGASKPQKKECRTATRLYDCHSGVAESA